jgi:hypothetical protein
MSKEFLHMQKLAGVITEGEYNAKMNENMFDDNNKAFGILYRKATPEDDYDPSIEYLWIEQNVEKYMEHLGYGDDSYDVATEVMDFAYPGSIDDVASLGMLDNPNYNPETTTIKQYRKTIESSFEK